MLTPELIARYKELRSKGSRVKWMGRALRHVPKPALDWDENTRTGERTATFDVEGFQVVATLRDDYESAWDIIEEKYGKFLRNWEPGCIDRKKVHGYVSTREYRYFMPECDQDEVRGYLRAHGTPRHDAWLQAHRAALCDLEKAESGDITFLWIDVTASRSGVELASESLGGIEFESWRETGPYIDDETRGLVDEAVAQAKKKLTELCGERCEA